MGNTTFTSGELVTATKLNTVDPSIISTGSTVARTLATRAADVMQVDDFADVQAGLNYIVANGGVLEFTKAKSYVVTTPLTAQLAVSDDKELRWEIRGNGATLDCSSFTGSQIGLTIGGTAQANLNEKGYYSISGLRILGPEATTPINFSATTTVVGLFINNAIRVNLTDVECTRCYTGIKTAYVFPLTATNCNVENNYIGLHLDDVSNLQKWNQLSAKQCWYSVIIIKSNLYSTAKIAGINFEGLWTEGSKVGVVVDPSNTEGRVIRSLRFANGFYKSMEFDAFRFGREWTFDTPETRGDDRAGKILDVEIEGGDFPGAPADANTGTFVFSTPPNCFGFFGHASVDIDDTLAWVNEPSMGDFLATGDEALGTVADFKKRFWNYSVRESPVLPPTFSGIAVTGATDATPIVVTSAAHGLVNGNTINISGVLGNTAANGVFLVANKATDTFELTTLTGVDVAGTGTYVSLSGVWRVSATEDYVGAYVTGDWTPVATFATPGDLIIAYTGVGFTYGTYTKIGRLVTVQFDLKTSTFTHTTASGDLRINNLPYQPRVIAGQTYRPVGLVSFLGINKTGFTHMNCVGAASLSVMNFSATGAAGSSISNVAAADCPTGGTLRLHGTIQYETDA